MDINRSVWYCLVEKLFNPSHPPCVMDTDEKKRLAGIEACRWVRDGMSLGLGTGSTVHHTIIELGRMVSEGEISVVGVPTSVATRDLAQSLGIPLTTLSEVGSLDLVIDGTDEFDPQFSLIKGGGGALTREKIVAQSSKAMIVVADERKQVDVLGRFHLPVEVLQFEWRATSARLAEICPGDVALRGGEHPFQTDNGGYIIDCDFGGAIDDPSALESKILSIAGVVEVGLFCDMCDAVILAGEDRVETLVKNGGRLG